MGWGGITVSCSSLRIYPLTALIREPKSLSMRSSVFYTSVLLWPSNIKICKGRVEFQLGLVKMYDRELNLDRNWEGLWEEPSSPMSS